MRITDQNKESRKNIICIVYTLLLITTLSALNFSYVNRFHTGDTLLLLLITFCVSVILHKPFLLAMYNLLILALLIVALSLSGQTYIEKDRLLIVFVVFFAINYLNVWLKYKRHRKLQSSEEKCRLLVTDMKQGLNKDISERKRMEQIMFEEKERFETTLLSLGDGVISIDKQGKVELLNKVAEQLTGWIQEEASGKEIDEVFNIINEFTRDKSENLLQSILDSGRPFLFADHRILIAKDGRERPIEENATPIKDVEGKIKGGVLVFRDITDQKERQNRIEYLSYRDQLTGLYNRRFYEEELKRLNTERNLPISIIMGDVNGLKLVNDAFGHEKGDELLLKAASAIRRACRTEDIVARWGGDEFVILLPKTKTEEAGEIVKRIKELYSNEYVNAVRVSIAFGWETKRKPDEDIQKVLKNAEDYMYKRKIIENEGLRDKTITAIIETLHEKNPGEQKHSQRVGEICQYIGQAIDLSEIEVSKLKVVGIFHDIGKIAIDESILYKPGKLTEKERVEIERHPDIGFRILNSSHDMSEIADCILAHHERWDGTGYPKGLKGEAIPMAARIIALAESYEAMTGERSYRKALSEMEVLAEIQRNSGTQFDPEIARIFLEKVLQEVGKLRG